jgi:hypothetical protein
MADFILSLNDTTKNKNKNINKNINYQTINYAKNTNNTSTGELSEYQKTIQKQTIMKSLAEDRERQEKELNEHLKLRREARSASRHKYLEEKNAEKRRINEAPTQSTSVMKSDGGYKNKKPSVPQSKEILGKQRRIYKVAGSRKEHVKYKGQLIPVSDYKKLMILKR